MHIYEKTSPVITNTDVPTIMDLDLVRLSASLSANSSNTTWASEHTQRGEYTFIQDRYDRMRYAIESGHNIEMPWIHAFGQQMFVMDGRHRLYALIDLGYSHVRVVADPEVKDAIFAQAG